MIRPRGLLGQRGGVGVLWLRQRLRLLGLITTIASRLMLNLCIHSGRLLLEGRRVLRLVLQQQD